MPTESSLKINVNKILSFFDEKPDWADRHSAGVVGMIFEDLAAATLEHCLHRNRVEHVAIRTESVTTGQKKGPRLDRWIAADLACGQKVLFQTEIKSVSAHSTGHKKIMLDASVEEMREHEQENWDGQWNSETNTLRHQPMAKVLVPMKRPAGTEDRRLLPLLIYWQPIRPKDHSQKQDQVEGGHLFKVTGVTYNFGFQKPHSWKINPTFTEKFTELWVFSISSYLRSIRNKCPNQLKLPMPIASNKMQALQSVVQVPLQTD